MQSHLSVVTSCLTALLVTVSVLTAGRGLAAVERPTYVSGDRWVYVLEGFLDGLPEMNASSVGSFTLTMAGRVDVTILGASERVVNDTIVPGFTVATSASGFLNGTFTLPGNVSVGDITVTGTFSSSTREFWEGQGHFAIESNGTSTYTADISSPFLSLTFSVETLNLAKTTAVSGPVFPLEIGERATASLHTDATTDSTVTAFGDVTRFSDATSFDLAWSREVLALETVTVDAGTFSTYRLNQSLGSFPVLATPAPMPGGNETAFWSNDVKQYVKRTAYANGTAVAEMRLRSYTPGGTWPASTVAIVIGLPVIAAVLAIALLLRRQRRRRATEPARVAASGIPDSRLPEEGRRAR